MNEGFTEPRTAIWAVAEVCWIDGAGQSLRAPATLEDTSASGACIRVKTPISVGSNLTIKWHREQFSGVARNCRSDGREFLLGVQRDGSAALVNAAVNSSAGALATKEEHVAAPPFVIPPAKAADRPPAPVLAQHQNADRAIALAAPLASIHRASSKAQKKQPDARTAQPVQEALLPQPASPASVRARQTSLHQERNIMESKGILPKFWRRHSDSSAAQDEASTAESLANKSQSSADAVRRDSELLAYDDIYHAAGILGAHAGYGIHKVLEMLNSDRIRDLAPEIKRASVLMAIEAAGASADDVLQDAMRRQHALDTYEAGQQKQIEEFESRKSKENAEIQAEMERVTAHYAERMQRNQDQVAQEKEALRNWQMAKQHESQRIAEVMSLCMREPAPAAAAAKAGAGSPRATAFGPSLLPDSHKKPE
jgi:hypothetical protein